MHCRRIWQRRAGLTMTDEELCAEANKWEIAPRRYFRTVRHSSLSITCRVQWRFKMLYRITDGTLAIGGENLLEHFDFEIKGRERIAITGPNGSGKTTFLRLIAGELFLERDDRRQGEGIYLARNVTIGMLRQQIFENTAHTVQEEMMVLCPSRDTSGPGALRIRAGI